MPILDDFDFSAGLKNIYGQGGPGDPLIALGTGLLSRRNVGEGLAQGFQNIQANQLLQQQRDTETLRKQQIEAQMAKANRPDYGVATVGNQLVSYDKNNPNAGANVMPGQPDRVTPHWATDPKELPPNYDIKKSPPIWINELNQPEIKGSPTTNINTSPGPAKDVFESVGKRAEVARSAAQSLPAFQQARQLVDSGQITLGAGADTRLAMQKYGALFGLDPTAAENTETFRSTVAPIVLSLVKGLGSGSGITNADRDFSEAAAGGRISLEPGSIRRLMDIGEKAARFQIDSYNKMLNSVYPDSDQNNAQVRALYNVEVPSYSAPQSNQSNAPVSNPGWRIKGGK